MPPCSALLRFFFSEQVRARSRVTCPVDRRANCSLCFLHFASTAKLATSEHEQSISTTHIFTSSPHSSSTSTLLFLAYTTSSRPWENRLRSSNPLLPPLPVSSPRPPPSTFEQTSNITQTTPCSRTSLPSSSPSLASVTDRGSFHSTRFTAS